jgi:DNA repair exonuclease SbcCD ATPase subunit
MQGPITVFEGSTYAGDGRIMDLQPNEERLISYAVDLGTEVKPEVAAESGRLTHLKAVKGLLYTTTKQRETKTYTVKNRNAQDRTVLIEHPVRPGFNLVSKDKPAETARDVYRFELKVPAGKSAKEVVTEEHDITSTVLLTNSPDEQIRIFLQSPVVSEKVKAGLKKAQELRTEWGRTQREIAEQQRQLQTITEDQARLRANLREVPQSSPLHKRYLDKLNKQEDEVEKYRAEVKKLQEKEHAQKKALDEFLASFSAE